MQKTTFLFTLLSCLFLLTACVPEPTATDTTAVETEPAATPAADEAMLFKRVTLLVSDMERSLGIYRDILGFTVNNRSVSGEDSYSYPVFKIPKEAKISFATLDSKTQERTLALTEVTGIDLPAPTVPIMTASVIKVTDLASVITKLQALGLETTAPKESESSDKKFTFIEQAFIDYDGHLIVLYDILSR